MHKCQCGREIVKGTPVCLSADVCRECWLEKRELHMMVHPFGCNVWAPEPPVRLCFQVTSPDRD